MNRYALILFVSLASLLGGCAAPPPPAPEPGVLVLFELEGLT